MTVRDLIRQLTDHAPSLDTEVVAAIGVDHCNEGEIVALGITPESKIRLTVAL